MAVPIHKIPSITVLLVDDQPGVRKGVRALLDAEGDIDVVGEAGSGKEALDLADEVQPDVVLMDVMMPGMNGIEASRRLHASHPEMRIIGFSLYDERPVRRAMFAAGVTSFVAKAAADEELVAAIREEIAKRPDQPSLP